MPRELPLQLLLRNRLRRLDEVRQQGQIGMQCPCVIAAGIAPVLIVEADLQRARAQRIEDDLLKVLFVKIHAICKASVSTRTRSSD
jgi:hypothetical protein